MRLNKKSKFSDERRRVHKGKKNDRGHKRRNTKNKRSNCKWRQSRLNRARPIGMQGIKYVGTRKEYIGIATDFIPKKIKQLYPKILSMILENGTEIQLKLSLIEYPLLISWLLKM